jgi:hypothetical protein
VENSITTNVGDFTPTLSHVRAAFVFHGVINADRRLRRLRGEVCPLAPAAPVQGIALSTVTPVVGTQVMGGAQFDKYRTGSHDPGLSG